MLKFRFSDPVSLLPDIPRPYYSECSIDESKTAEICDLIANCVYSEDAIEPNLEVLNVPEVLEVPDVPEVASAVEIAESEPTQSAYTKRNDIFPADFQPLHKNDIERFTVKALKNQCNHLGLDSKGTRLVLINKLRKHYNV